MEDALQIPHVELSLLVLLVLRMLTVPLASGIQQPHNARIRHVLMLQIPIRPMVCVTNS